MIVAASQYQSVTSPGHHSGDPQMPSSIACSIVLRRVSSFAVGESFGHKVTAQGRNFVA